MVSKKLYYLIYVQYYFLCEYYNGNPFKNNIQVWYNYLRNYCPKKYINSWQHAHSLRIRYITKILGASTQTVLGPTSVTADKIKINSSSLKRFWKDQSTLSEILCESVKCIYVYNLPLYNYPILEYLEYLKWQLTEASSVHLQTQSSKFLDLSKLTKLPAGLKLRRLSIGKLKSKRYSSKFEGKLVYVLWSYQNSHVFMQANCRVGISKNWSATVITPKYLAVRNFKFLDLKAITVLPTSHFKCKELLQFYSEQCSNKYNNYGTMTIQNTGLVNIEKKFTVNSFWAVKSQFWNIADSLDDIKEKQIKVGIRMRLWLEEKDFIDEAYQQVNQLNINSLKLDSFETLLRNDHVRLLVEKLIKNNDSAKAFLKIEGLWIKDINQTKREFIEDYLRKNDLINMIRHYKKDINDWIEIYD